MAIFSLEGEWNGIHARSGSNEENVGWRTPRFAHGSPLGSEYNHTFLINRTNRYKRTRITVRLWYSRVFVSFNAGCFCLAGLNISYTRCEESDAN